MGWYCRPLSQDEKKFKEELKKTPMRLRKLIIARNLERGHWIRAAKDQGKSRLFRKSRKGGEWGQLHAQAVTQWPRRHDGKVRVEWNGGMDDYTNCKIMEYSVTKPVDVHRRLTSRDNLKKIREAN